MAWRGMILFGHDMRKYSTDRKTADAAMQGKMERKRRNGRPADTWFQSIIYNTEQSWIWRRLNYWRLIAKDGGRIRVTAAHIAPPE